MFRLVEVRIVNPEFAAITNRRAWICSFHFAPEKIGRGESDRAAGDERLLQETGCFLFGELSGERWELLPVPFHSFDELDGFGRTQVRGLHRGSQQDDAKQGSYQARSERN